MRGSTVFHLTSLEYRPNSTIPPKMSSLTPSQMKPKAAQPVGFSPLTCGANHWLVAAEKRIAHALVCYARAHAQ